MTYNDFAIILTWPDATIRGDEKWMMFFKKIGIVKNLNFKVGHTGIVLVNHLSGEMLFYDFGRYITPRGYGRARSKDSDPLLNIPMNAVLMENKIQNLNDIIESFEELKLAMHGEGRLFYNVVENVDFNLAKKYGDQCVMEGTYPYGAVAKGNNNCSRFITRMLMKASKKYHFWHSINFPETIKASPISNIINVHQSRMVSSYSPLEGFKTFRMNRWNSFLFLVRQLRDNVFRAKAELLPNDLIIGAVEYESKPLNIPRHAKYLGGVCDGAWYDLTHIGGKRLEICRYTTKGKLEYVVVGESSIQIDLNQPWEITYDSHQLSTHIIQFDQKIKINHIQNLAVKDLQNKNMLERYA